MFFNLIKIIVYFSTGKILESRCLKLRFFSPAIFRAAYAGNVEKLTHLLSKGINIDARQRNGTTPLMAASLSGNADTVRFLVERTANVNAKNNVGESPIVFALLLSKTNYDVIELLLSNGADVNTAASGMTPLMYASMTGNEKVVELLISKGADVQAKNNDGASSLMLAVIRGFPKIVSILIEHGADINDCEKDGLSIMAAASFKNNNEILHMLRERGAKGEITNCCLRK